MSFRRPSNLKAHSFTNEQIRAKAYEIWQKHPEKSEEENWDEAIKVLQAQRVLQPFLSLWRWTGFGEKKLWDLLQLLVSVSIPIVLFLGGQYFTTQNNDKQQKLADDKAKQDRQLADDKAKQDTLVKYLDQMADSLKDGLLSAKPGSEKFIIAQSRTVIALQSLDKNRQHLIMQFLLASGLSKVSDEIQPDKNGKLQLRDGDQVLLYQAQMSKANLASSDLSGSVLIGANFESANLGCIPPESKDPSQCSDLKYANLTSANLYGANLISADLSRALLNSANLSNANLSSANLTQANLSFANLSDATLNDATLNDAIVSFVNFKGAHLKGSHLMGAYFWDDSLKDTDLEDVNLNGAIVLTVDFRQAKALTQGQLKGANPPLLCNIALPKAIQVNPDRDCARLPQVLLERYPQAFKNLEQAKQHVEKEKRKQW